MSGLEISNIEYLVIVGYLALIVAVGLVFKKFSSNTDDYFRGGCKGTWWLVGSSAFMSAFSAWTFTGAAGIAYESGFTVMFIYIGNALGFFANYLFMGPWLRQMRVTTFPEAIAMRFGEKTRDSVYRAKVDGFFKLMKTPIAFEKEIGEGNDLRQLTVIGRFGAAVAGFVALLLLIPNPIEGRIAILVLSLVIGSVSALMIKAGRKSDGSAALEEGQTV